MAKPLIRTNLGIVVTCKCGSTVAAHLIYGGTKIGKGFTRLIAQTHVEGGCIDLVDVVADPIKLQECTCDEGKEASNG